MFLHFVTIETRHGTHTKVFMTETARDEYAMEQMTEYWDTDTVANMPDNIVDAYEQISADLYVFCMWWGEVRPDDLPKSKFAAALFILRQLFKG